MEISLNRDILLPALQVVAPAIETKQTLPMLSNVLWVAEGGQLTLLGTDLEIELTATVALSQTVSNFATTIPARKLLDIIRSLPEAASCQFRFTDKQCHIQCGQNRFVLSTLPAENFPRLKSEAGEIEFLVKQSDFLTLLQSTHFAMAVSDARYYLNGLYISLAPGRLSAIATDGHRLACTDVKTNLHEGLAPHAFLLPRNAVLELIRLLTASDAMLTVNVAKGYCRLVAEGFTFASKLIEGRVPDYQRAIPARGEHCWTFERSALKAAVSQVALVIADKTKGVRLSNVDNVCQLHAYDAGTGEADVQVDGEFVGENIVVGLNAAYLLDVINAIAASRIQVYFTGSQAAATVVGEGDDSSFYVIMPMRV